MTEAKPKNPIRVYCEESSIHGVPFLVSKGIHWIEKVFWLIAIVVSICCCSFLIYEIGVKVQEDLTVIYSSEYSTNITEIPFPAITYCPELLNELPPKNGQKYFNSRYIKKSLESGNLSIEDLTETE
jgi:Amiloride-sensitive sodium channel